jgi:hypothetical protein
MLSKECMNPGFSYPSKCAPVKFIEVLDQGFKIIAVDNPIITAKIVVAKKYTIVFPPKLLSDFTLLVLVIPVTKVKKTSGIIMNFIRQINSILTPKTNPKR